GLAEFERSLIAARTATGRGRAKAAGVRFGRRPKLNAYQRAEALKRLDAGEPQSAVARTFGIDQSTVSRLVGAARLTNEQTAALPSQSSAAFRFFGALRPLGPQ